MEDISDPGNQTETTVEKPTTWYLYYDDFPGNLASYWTDCVKHDYKVDSRRKLILQSEDSSLIQFSYWLKDHHLHAIPDSLEFLWKIFQTKAKLDNP
ncbi:hypothetical protein CLV58_109119 [Spirosoma oryzae]|uniref:Uncharacterized protein n=1 Tax=Spirosoma oryzae TaxID=1469603 RepID=A0A2T0SY90_9BACT|nr:hypothetical protein [Spirosoma oryzae]PRY38392.1 hypothetical protein CLV58_109119 [Spirosoma oryzae]